MNNHRLFSGQHVAAHVLPKIVLGLVLFFSGSGIIQAQKMEVELTPAEVKNLDTRELRSLNRADKAFNAGSYREACAAYEEFMKEYPKTAVMPYALMRKGRSMQWDVKRFEAIKIYNEVLDYFPDVVEYAAAALYYTGECHALSGNTADALKFWKEMAEDKDYRKHRLAAIALNALSAELLKQNEIPEAAKFYLQVAVDFRSRNESAARQAIAQLIFIYVRVRPDVEKLRNVCKQVKSFGNPDSSKAENDEYFWESVRRFVRTHGSSFTAEEAPLKISYYRYWAGAMEGKCKDDDDFQKDVADFYLYADRDVDKWMARLDKQFDSYQKPEDFARIGKWIKFYLEYPKKVDQYYSKLMFPRMDNAVIIRLMLDLFQMPKGHAMAKSVYAKLNFGKMKDKEKVSLARSMWGCKVDDLVADLCHRVDDKALGNMEELRYYASGNVLGAVLEKTAIPLADQCIAVPDYAQESYLIKGQLLGGMNKLEAAIQCYQLADKPPLTLYAIADCLLALGRLNPAVEQLREVENFFKDESAAAALKIAEYYNGAGKRDLYVAELRAIMKKYKNTRQSSTAHEALEKMGYKPGGGEDAK